MIPALTDVVTAIALPASLRLSAIAIMSLASTALTTPVQGAEFPAIIRLAWLDGTTGFRLDGAAEDDRSGFPVASAGDVNGDGFGDVIIGAAEADPNGSSAGSSYVVFGTDTGFAATFDLSSLNGSNGFRVDGVATLDGSGISVAAAGDINGDGFGDLVIGAIGADQNGNYSGSSYVVFGKASGFAAAIDLFSLNGSNGFRLDGESIYDRSGRSVASAGDVNGDGFDDLIIGAWEADPHNHSGYGNYYGSSYVVFGKATGFAASMNLSSLDGSNGFRLDGAAIRDYSGYSVAAAGDVNGDGFGDVIIGARGSDPHGEASGSSYVVFGKARGFSASMDLSSLNGSNGFRLDGEAAFDFSGACVAAAGDVNGDGFDDVIIGALLAGPLETIPGSSYVVFGKAGGFAAAIDLSSLNGVTGFRLDGIGDRDRSGASVAAAGDINGDGFGDVIIGAWGSDLHGYNSGVGYVVFGKASNFDPATSLSSLDGRTGFRLTGRAAHDQTGISVSSAGDVNADGFGDVIVGAPGASSDFGSSYVVFGRAPDRAVLRTGSRARQYISGGPFADTLDGRNERDALEGRDGPDILIGGANSDTASYQHARTRVTANLGNPANNTGEAAGDSYASIGSLIGSRFGDTLTGDHRANRLTGSEGPDMLTGGEGQDVFALTTLRDSPPGTRRDRIRDFDAGTTTTTVDKIGLSAIDAKTGPGNQPFSFIGTQAFSNTKGELRVQASGSDALISGDVNGDGAAEFEIRLLNFNNIAGLTAADFRL